MILAIAPSPPKGYRGNAPKTGRRLNPLKGDIAQTSQL
jgi:hypothetical protein